MEPKELGSGEEKGENKVSGREKKQHCGGCGILLATSRIYVFRQKELCKVCIKIARSKPSEPTERDLIYNEALRKQMKV